MHKRDRAEQPDETQQNRELLLILRKKGRTAIRLNITLQIITLLTAIGALIFYFVEDERGLDITVNHIFQCVGALVILNIPLLIQRKFRCYIPNFITITLYVYIFAHFILGEIYRAYDRVFLYDKILHATGGIVFSILSFSVVWLLNNREGNRSRLSPFFIVLFTFCFTMTAEYLWELIEYAADRLFGLNMQRWQDSIIEGAQVVVDGAAVDGTAHSVPYGNAIRDTMGDMFVNVIGCLVICAISYVGMRMRPHWFENKVILTEKQFRAMLAREEQQSDEPVVDLVFTPDGGRYRLGKKKKRGAIVGAADSGAAQKIAAEARTAPEPADGDTIPAAAGGKDLPADGEEKNG